MKTFIFGCFGLFAAAVAYNDYLRRVQATSPHIFATQTNTTARPVWDEVHG